MRPTGPWPFRGTVVWLTPEQGGRTSGPPPSDIDRAYAHTAFVPPRTVEDGLASFVLHGYEDGAWISSAKARWLVVENEGEFYVQPGTVVVCTEGPRVVAYFTVEQVE